MSGTGVSDTLTTVKTVLGPAVGWKVARASVLDDTSTLLFRAMTNGSRYEAIARARCHGGMASVHRAPPVSGCRCGFNAWNDIDVAYRYLRMRDQNYERKIRRSQFRDNWWIGGFAVLRVALFGQVIEGTLNAAGGCTQYGYRAEKQRVTDMFFERRCHFCDRRNVRLYYYDKGIRYEDNEFLRVHALMQLCPRDASIAHIPIDTDELTQRSNVGIHWGRASE